jgi:dihydrofolate reductase
MPTFGQGSHGNDEFLAECGAVVMGRTTFDQGLEYWLQNWPYPDRQVYVLTSRPLPANAPASVLASKGGPAGLVEQLRAAGLTRDVQLLGGPRTIHAFLELGALDRLGMVVLPILLHKGIPLFDVELTAFSGEAWAASQASPSPSAGRSLELAGHRTFPDGAVELTYSPR